MYINNPNIIYMPKKNLEILKVKDKTLKDNRFDDIPEELLKPPFLLIVNGSVRSGKSVLVQNFIYNDNFYKGYFDNITYISPTVHNDNTLQFMREDDEITMLDNPAEHLDDYLKAILKNQEENENEHTLVVIDDCLGFIRKGSYLTYLCTRYRHYKISLIITSQDFRSIPNIIRQNASAYIIFKTPNKKEFQKMQDEFEAIIEHFKELYDYSTNKLYNFIFINLRNLNVYHNFTERLYDKEKDEYAIELKK